MDVLAPLSGVTVPLDTVPDPVFAGKLVGDGVSIDPTSAEVLAPVDGTVSQLHPSHHALAVKADNGVEVLVHVGLDTVELRGRGFTALAAEGDRVVRGQPILRFDPELIAREARSLLTQVIVTSGDPLDDVAHGTVTAGQCTLLRVVPAVGGDEVEPSTGEAVFSGTIAVPNPVGLHARPAAVLAHEARKFAARIRLVKDGREVNAKSVVAVMGLAVQKGDRVTLRASGSGAQEAVLLLESLLRGGCGEPLEAPARAPVLPARPAAAPTPARGLLGGVSASPGLAIGRVFQHRHAAIAVPEAGGTPREERERLEEAFAEARRQLEGLKRSAPDKSQAEILDVQIELLADPDLVEATEAALEAGKSAAFAWQAAFGAQVDALEHQASALLRERAADVRDVGRRVLAVLSGVEHARILVPEGSILVAEELTPSDTAELDRARVVGFCTVRGGATSHVAILARSLGIPAVCGIDERALGLADGLPVVLDGTHGALRVEPDAEQVAEVRERIAQEATRRAAEASAAFQRAATRDGQRVEVAANVHGLEDARAAVLAGAEGVGLLRTEFLFADRETPPTEDEQAAAYTAVAEALGRERPLVIRTLDVGGDKPLPFLPLPREDNPFLGVRGLRVSLERQDLFRDQLRAVLRAAGAGNVHLMFPMVSDVEEVRIAKRILAEERARLPAAEVKVGVMIEVPSAAVLAGVLAREVDFFSIGTNDLTQYTMAMDRGHPRLARHADALHPAVLHMIASTVEGAHAHGKWVGVCGGLASDTLAVPVLVGLGVDELSVSVPVIASVKATLARWSVDECRALAAEALGLGTAAEVRALLAAKVE